MSNKHYSVLIIGGGIAGLTAAIYSARAGLSTLVVEGDFVSNTQMPGGQLMLTPEIENYPGFMGSGYDLIDFVKDQAEKFGAHFITAQIEELNINDSLKTVKVGDEDYSGDAIILATGSVAKRLGIPGEDEFFGRGVSVCATCDGAFFKGQDVVVVGGGNVAVEDALHLSALANKVYLVHRRDALRASSPQSRTLLSTPNVEFIWEDEVETVLSKDDSVVGVSLKSGVVIPASGLFVAIGHNPETEPFQKTYLELDDYGFISVQKGSAKTNIEGVFAAGDVADPVYKQAITAAGSGCMAALDAQHYLSR